MYPASFLGWERVDTAEPCRHVPTLVVQDGTTPLHLAAWKGYVGIVKELLAMGARADRANVTGQSALHEAASQGHTDVVRVLLEAGAMPNRQDSEGLTPAALALRAGFRDLASELAQRIREVLFLPLYSPVAPAKPIVQHILKNST